jgi:hypothetical protein
MSLPRWKQIWQVFVPASGPSQMPVHIRCTVTRLGLAGFQAGGSESAVNWECRSAAKLQSPGPWSHVSGTRCRAWPACTLAFQYGHVAAT